MLTCVSASGDAASFNTSHFCHCRLHEIQCIQRLTTNTLDRCDRFWTLHSNQRTTFGVQKFDGDILAEFAIPFLLDTTILSIHRRNNLFLAPIHYRFNRPNTYHTVANDGAILCTTCSIRYNIEKIVIHFGHN